MLSRAANMLLALVYSIAATIVATIAMRHLDLDGAASTGGKKHLAEARGLVTPPATGCRLADVGGLADAKEKLRRWVLLPLRHPTVFYGSARALRPAAGVLLHGPPGTGKTMLVRSLAAECGVPLIALHAAALESKWWGESPKLLAAVFALARTEIAPCIVFFDEVDGLGRARSEGDQSCVYSLKCELLRNMDGLQDSTAASVIVIGCTNCPQRLDPALRRRFQRDIHIGLPTRDDRLEILRRLEPRGPLRRVAAATEGMSGADLAGLHSAASLQRLGAARVERDLAAGRIRSGEALLRSLGPLSWEHWEAALRKR